MIRLTSSLRAIVLGLAVLMTILTLALFVNSCAEGRVTVSGHTGGGEDDDELWFRVIFHGKGPTPTMPGPIKLVSSKITSPDGQEYPLAEWHHYPSKVSYAIEFTVNSSQIDESVERIDCEIDFSVGKQKYFVVGAFVRDSERASGWRALGKDECMIFRTKTK